MMASGLAGLGVIVLAILAAVWLSRRIARPIRRLASGATMDFTLSDHLAAPSGTRTLTILPGFNFISFTGADGTLVAGISQPPDPR